MSHIYLFVPYFGKFPNYFQLYLDSLRANTDCLTVFIITDIDVDADTGKDSCKGPYIFPPNAIRIPMTLQIIRERMRTFLQEEYDHLVSAESLLLQPYKLVDIKIIYPILFDDIIQEYNISENDFVGWGDIDLIYGKLSNFIDFNENYYLIGGRNGHFTAIRNIHSFKQVFKRIPDYVELCTDSKVYGTDEIAYQQSLIAYLEENNYKMFDMGQVFCDIVPPCFFELFRPNYKTYKKNFFNNIKPHKNINYLYYDKKTSVLKTVYDDGESYETTYCHLHKRKMDLPFSLSNSEYNIGYYIGEYSFSLEKPNANIKPDNVFDCFVINLDRRSDRLEKFCKMNGDKINFVRTKAIDGRELEFKQNICINDKPIISEIISDKFSNLKIGEIGCFLSHYFLWKKISQLEKPCIIFEDDVILCNDFNTKLNRMFKEGLPNDFHLLYLGVWQNFENDYFYRTYIKNNKDSLINNHFFRFNSDNNLTGCDFYAYAYIVSPKSCKLLCEHVEKNTYKLYPVDNFLCRFDNKYICFYNDNKPFLCHAPQGDSDIQPNPGSSKNDNTYKIRLHLPAIPYTITSDDYSHDAFTGKVKRFSPMMRSVGYEVYHYGIETSESNADKDIQLLTKDEWNKLRIDSLLFLEPNLTRDQAEIKINDPSMFVGMLANWGTPLFKEFNRRFRERLQENYRHVTTDIVCIPLGHSYDDALIGLNYVMVEIGIGYNDSCHPFRVFESHNWLSATLTNENKDPNNYWFVIPHSFDVDQFVFNPNPIPRRVGFLGRISNAKGCHIIVEIAKRFPDVEFILCGQGNADEYIKQPNVKYKAPIHGKERSEYLGNCIALLFLTTYLEPFGCTSVEAQLCGTPVIATDFGGPVETIEQFKTGLRGHTLSDYCKGVQMALNNEFDRGYIRDRAAKLYGMYNVAHQYDYVLRSILDLYKPEKNGWYSPDTYIERTNI